MQTQTQQWQWPGGDQEWLCGTKKPGICLYPPDLVGAELLNGYHKDFLNPYINFHRPCFFPVTVIDHRGKVKRTYPYEEVMTPYEKLKSLPKAESCLRPGITFEALDAIANQMSDNQFAERMVKARSDLFQQISISGRRVVWSWTGELSMISKLSKRKKKVAKKKESYYYCYYYHSG